MSEQVNPQVIIETSMGKIKVELFKDKAPITVKNFLGYVKENHYDGLIFHRVIKDFMIQGGGMSEALEPKKTKFAIKNEASNGLSNKRGTLAMARTAIVDSATCQFFINTVDNYFLDHQGKQQDRFGYCVFGQVIEGLEVVDEIRAVKTGTRNGHSDVPLEPVFIKTITLNTKNDVMNTIENQLLELLKHEEMLAYWEFKCALPEGIIEGLCRVSRSTPDSSGGHYCSIILITDTPDADTRKRAESVLADLQWDKMCELLPDIEAVITIPSLNPPDSANLVVKKNLITPEGFDVSKHFIFQTLYPAFIQMSHFTCGDLLFWENR